MTREFIHNACKGFLILFAFAAIVLVIALCGLVAVKVGGVLGIWLAGGGTSVDFLVGLSLFEKIVVIELGVIALAQVFTGKQRITVTGLPGKKTR